MLGMLWLLPGVSGCSQLPSGASRGREQQRDFFARDAVMLSARGSASHLAGDFDGRTTLLGPDTIRVPRAGNAYGTGYALGVLKRGVGIEAAFNEVEYGPLRYRNVAFNGLRYYRAGDALQPFILLGILFPWIQVDNASMSMGQVGEARISGGIGLQSGFGVSYFLDPRISLDLRGLLSWQSFSRAEGVSNLEAPIGDNLQGLGWSLSLGISFGLVPIR